MSNLEQRLEQQMDDLQTKKRFEANERLYCEHPKIYVTPDYQARKVKQEQQRQYGQELKDQIQDK